MNFDDYFAPSLDLIVNYQNTYHTRKLFRKNKIIGRI